MQNFKHYSKGLNYFYLHYSLLQFYQLKTLINKNVLKIPSLTLTLKIVQVGWLSVEH
jgi:hypothetical protein